MVGSKGKAQILLGITEDGLPAFALLDAHGKLIVDQMNNKGLVIPARQERPLN